MTRRLAIADKIASEYDKTVRELEPATARSAWTLKAAIIATAFVLLGAVTLVLFIQHSAEDRCDEVRQQLEQQWAIVLDQLNDRLDDQSAALTRCHTNSDAIEADVRHLQKLLLPDDDI